MNYTKATAKEAAHKAFRGIFAAITTPFTQDLRTDEAGLRHNMRYMTDTLHVDGVFCAGVMGEFRSLTIAERKRVVEIVVEEHVGNAKSSRIPVIIAHLRQLISRSTQSAWVLIL